MDQYQNSASPYGAYNMAGNVWEWVDAWYDAYPFGDSGASGDFGQKHRVLRGGDWNHLDISVRTTNRGSNVPTNSYFSIGFRCASSAAP